ncbi:MAG: DUF1934 domain-containing protein [Oscillospiraceae bacterium]
MKKDVFITIKGIQKVDDEKDTTELFTQGNFYKKNNNYYITYDESEATGFQGSTTTLKVEGNDKVTLIRSGTTRSHLIVQNGERNIGHYGTAEGNLAIGVYTKQIKSSLDDNGGDLFFSYSLDINSNLISENEVYINIKGN